MKTYLNTLILFVVALAISGAGYYVTEVNQPATLKHLRDVDRVARLQHAQVAQLLAEAEQSSDRADATVRKWNSRFRYVPADLSTPDIVDYLEELTPKGFEAFDVRLEDVQESPDVNHYRFSIDGTGQYKSLYEFVWQIENRPDFYRIHDLEMSRTTVFEESRSSRGTEMVQFSMTLDAYFGGLDGLSTDRDLLADVPEEAKPAAELPHNSFYPLVRERRTVSSSSNSGLVDVRHASLVSIAGSRAIFQDGNSQFILYEGSSVANGTIVRIDPLNVVVRASLTIDGKTEIIDIGMDSTPPSYRQAEGDNRLVPVETGQNP
ncbi:hypothetical protein CRI94_15205 [Longibacter salinarum]|uniref:Pilus assembly protein PilP n=1 Tax=Longibacter salinarum TaxID=1850348 RepID=A0A2A8CUF6_9BACT|nr:hypothetical protein [Longibacter salinarum]PEN11384.1 hypothetical protein CRI94_15205 [Longibacter salinarum]